MIKFFKNLVVGYTLFLLFAFFVIMGLIAFVNFLFYTI